MEWIRTDDDGNVIARGIVGEDDPNDESVTSEGKVDKVKEEEGDRDKAKELSGVSTNRCVLSFKNNLFEINAVRFAEEA